MDDGIGLLCAPPGMSVQQIKEFNKRFAGMNEKERSNVIENMAHNLTKKNQSVAEAITESLEQNSK